MSRATRFFVFVVLALSLVMALPGGALAVQSQDTATFSASVEADASSSAASLPLQAVAPAPARVGELVTFTLRSNGAQNLAGFQFSLRYDDLGLDLYKVELSDELKALGYDVLSSDTVRSADAVSFAAAACPVGDCASSDYSQPRVQSAGALGDVPLAHVQFYVRAQGDYAFVLDQAQMVSPEGLSVISPDGATQRRLEALSLDAMDLTQNGFINDSDAWQVIGEWANLNAEGKCTAPAVAHYDLDGSGCIDIADAQLILSHWGGTVNDLYTPAPASPDSEDEVTAIFTVNDPGDAPDAAPGNGTCATAGGVCTLRAAIEESNVLAGADTINFNIRLPGNVCPALVAIQPATTLEIDDPSGAGVTINGYTQCNAVANSSTAAGNAVIKIEIRGNQTASVYGLRVSSQNNTIRGLSIFDFNSQIMLRGSRSHHNTIQGNFIGTNAANDHRTSFTGENDGIDIELNAATNLVGGTTAAARNVISGNDQDGVNIQGEGVTANVVIGNFIGLNQNGTASLRNQSDGVDLAGGAHNNRIGGTAVGERNVISGNGGDGVEISHGGAHDNDVAGNFIGLNVSGNGTTRNQQKGVTFEDIIFENRVYRNVIAGNGGFGVRFFTADDNQVYDNFIGVYPPGIGPGVVVPLPSAVALNSLVDAPNGAAPANDAGLTGVLLMGGSQGNLLARNVIANHPEYGIAVSIEKGYLPTGTCETFFNTFSRNAIFDNGLTGIRLYSGPCEGTGPVVSANQGIAFPVINTATTTQVTGTACANCTVEIFLADKTQLNHPSGDNNGEGKQFLGSGTANGSGNFSITIAATANQLVTATATSGTGNTSQFALNKLVTPTTQTTERLLLPLIFK